MFFSEDLRSAWQYTLFRSLVEIKSEASKYYLGILWWILEPLAYLGTFYIVFEVGLKTAGMALLPGETSAVMFLLTALVPWKWFSTTISTASRSIEGQAGLIQQVDIKKWTLIVSVVLSNFWKFLLILALLFVFLALNGYTPELRWLQLIPIIGLQMVFTTGLAIWVAISIPFIPDLRLVVENGLFIAFLSAGVFFDVSTWPAHAQAVLDWHPMVWFLDAYRSVLLKSGPVDWSRLLIWGGAGLFISLVGLSVLRKVERVIPRLL